MRFAYADPPYCGMGASMYGYPEWDKPERHAELVAELVRDFPDGWVLSCNPRDLRWLLPRCPEAIRVCAWVKPYHQIRPTSVQFAWEPVLLYGGRSVPGRNPMVRDWWLAGATRQKAIRGAKPSSFCAWVLDLLGFQPADDELVDLFPGSGVMGHMAAQTTLTGGG